MKDSWIEKIGKKDIEPETNKRTDLTFAVQRYVVCHAVPYKLYCCLKIIKKMRKIVSTSRKKMFKVFGKSSSSTKLYDSSSFLKKLTKDYLIDFLSLLQNHQ